MSKKVVGIDLGTTNSVVSVMEGGSPRVLENSEGDRKTPSVVAYKDNGERLVGAPAKRQAVTNPERTISSIKRFMGRFYDEVQEEIEAAPYDLRRGEDGTLQVSIDDDVYTPQEISAMVLQKLKRTAEDYLQEEVTEAVVTVPAYFNDAQRSATQEAGEIAGLNIKRIINEPTAASLAYGLDDGEEKTIAVYDFGGGTFDISILDLESGVFRVQSTSGDTHLGGNNFDKRLLDYIADAFEQNSGIDLREDPTALQRLKEACETAKIELSSSETTQINLPYITGGTGQGPQHLEMNLTRSTFEKLIDDLIEQTIPLMESALDEAGYSRTDVDEVLLVGGSTRIPLIEETVAEFFGQKPSQSVSSDEVVAHGAAVQGGVISGDVDDVLLLDVTPLNLGIETLGGISSTMIEENTTIPTKEKEVFSTASDNQESVEVHILQGDRELAKDNRTLGRFTLDGIPPAPRGVPQIEVTFSIDADGILNVSAVDKDTGTKQSVEVEANSNLSDEEIEKMQEEAEEYAREDEKRRERAEMINQANSTVYSIEEGLEEYGDNLSNDLQVRLENALKELDQQVSTASADESIGGLEKALREAEEVWQEAGDEIRSARREEMPRAKEVTGEGSSSSETSSRNGGDAQVKESSADAEMGKNGKSGVDGTQDENASEEDTPTGAESEGTRSDDVPA